MNDKIKSGNYYYYLKIKKVQHGNKSTKQTSIKKTHTCKFRINRTKPTTGL